MTNSAFTESPYVFDGVPQWQKSGADHRQRDKDAEEDGDSGRLNLVSLVQESPRVPEPLPEARPPVERRPDGSDGQAPRKGSFTEEQLERIAARFALYNSLPPAIRKQLSGSDRQLDPKAIMTAIKSGNLENGPGKVLFVDLPMKLKEMRIRERENIAALNRQIDNHEKQRADGAQQLAAHTRKGLSFVDRINPLDPSYRYEYEGEQISLIGKVDGADISIRSKTKRVSEAQGRLQLLELAGQLYEHSYLTQQGKQKEADRKAVEMWGKYGEALKQLAPSVWRELAGPGANGKTAFERLKAAGETHLKDVPRLHSGTFEGFLKGNEQLRALTPARSGMRDTPAIRAQALSAIDADPALGKMAKGVRAVAEVVPTLQTLFQGGIEGTKFHDFVDSVRERTARLETALREAMPHLGTMRHRVEEMKRTEATTQDAKAKQELRDRIQALESTIHFFDPNSKTNQQLMAMVKVINSPKFDANTVVNWFKREGAVIAAAIGVAVAAVATLASCGVTSPLLIAAVAAGGALIGSEVAKESFYHLNIGLGDGDRSRLGSFMAGEKIMDGKTGQLRNQNFWGDVALPYAKEYAINFGLMLATMGIGNIAAKSINSALTKMGSARASALLAKCGPQIEKVLANSARLEKEAAKHGAKGWWQSFRKEVAEEFADETKEGLTEQVLKSKLGQANGYLSFAASVLVATRKGVKLDLVKGDTIKIDAGNPETMQNIIDEAKKQNFKIKTLKDDLFHVTTPDGHSFKLQFDVKDSNAQQKGKAKPEPAASSDAKKAGGDSQAPKRPDKTAGSPDQPVRGNALTNLLRRRDSRHDTPPAQAAPATDQEVQQFGLSRQPNGDLVFRSEKIGTSCHIGANGKLIVTGASQDGTSLIGKTVNGSRVESVTFGKHHERALKLENGSIIEFDGSKCLTRFSDGRGRTAEAPNGSINVDPQGRFWGRNRIIGTNLEISQDGRLRVTGEGSQTMIGKPLLGSQIESVTYTGGYEGKTDYKLANGTVIVSGKNTTTITDKNGNSQRLPHGITFDGEKFHIHYTAIGSDPAFHADGSLTFTGSTSDSLIGKQLMGSPIESITIGKDGLVVARNKDGWGIQYEATDSVSPNMVRKIIDSAGKEFDVSSTGMEFSGNYGGLRIDSAEINGRVSVNPDGTINLPLSDSQTRLGSAIQSRSIHSDGTVVERLSNGTSIKCKDGNITGVDTGKAGFVDVSALNLRMTPSGTIVHGGSYVGTHLTLNSDGSATITGDNPEQRTIVGRNFNGHTIDSVTIHPSGLSVHRLSDGTALTIQAHESGYFRSVGKIEKDGTTVTLAEDHMLLKGDQLSVNNFDIGGFTVNADGSLTLSPSTTDQSLIGKEMLGGKVASARISPEGALEVTVDNGMKIRWVKDSAPEIFTADNKKVDLEAQNMILTREGSIIVASGPNAGNKLGKQLSVNADGSISVSGKDLSELQDKTISGTTITAVQSAAGESIVQLKDGRQIIINSTGEMLRLIDGAGKTVPLAPGFHFHEQGRVGRGFMNYPTGDVTINSDGTITVKDAGSGSTTTVKVNGETTFTGSKGQTRISDAQGRPTRVDTIFAETIELLYNGNETQPHQIKLKNSTLSRQPDGTWRDQAGKLFARSIDVTPSGEMVVHPPDTFRINDDAREVENYRKNADGTINVTFKEAPAEQILLPGDARQPAGTDKLAALKARGDLTPRPDGTLLRKDGNGGSVVYDFSGTVLETIRPDGTTYKYKYAADGEQIESLEVSRAGNKLYQIRKSSDGPAFIRVKQDGVTEPISIDGKPVISIEAEADGSLTMLNTDYVGHKFTPDGATVFVDSVGRETIDGRFLPSERKKLETIRDRMFDNSDRRWRFNDLMKGFETRYTQMAKDLGVSDAERDAQVARVYHQLNKMLAAPEGAIPLSQRQVLAEQFLLEATHPRTIAQGHFNTCNVTAEEQVRLMSRSPGDMAQMLADVATTGRYVTADGYIIDMREMKGALTPRPESASTLGQYFKRRNDFSDISNYGLNSQRNFLDQILQNTCVEIYWQTRTISPYGGKPVRPASTIHDLRAGVEPYRPGDIRYELGDPRGNSSTGEFLVDYTTDPPTRRNSFQYDTGVDPLSGKKVTIVSEAPANAPELGDEALVSIGKEITGRTDPVHYLRFGTSAINNGAVRTVSNETELLTALKEMKAEGAFPLTVVIDARNLAPSLVSDAPHVINVHNCFEKPPGSGQWFVEYTNQWGAKDDRLSQPWGSSPANNRGPIPLSGFFALMDNRRKRTK